MSAIDKIFEMVAQDARYNVRMEPVKKACDPEKFMQAEAKIANGFSSLISSISDLNFFWDDATSRKVEVEFSPEQQMKLQKEIVEKMNMLQSYLNNMFSSSEYEVSYEDEDDEDEEDEDDEEDEYEDE